MQEVTCPAILMMPLPNRTAPKNVANGIPKWPAETFGEDGVVVAVVVVILVGVVAVVVVVVLSCCFWCCCCCCLPLSLLILPSIADFAGACVCVCLSLSLSCACLACEIVHSVHILLLRLVLLKLKQSHAIRERVRCDSV